VGALSLVAGVTALAIQGLPVSLMLIIPPLSTVMACLSAILTSVTGKQDGLTAVSRNAYLIQYLLIYTDMHQSVTLAVTLKW
jgi:hypothetical protein